ncbi:hypothetical protein P6709_16700 [Jeotgalibacillus sp. ET6]|uniref:hypothetical protein n=1 Tax=Jeotgalibacillus sp. ET6 TaxID=3037260 RepID=UPI00241878E4|nr:hypothetical protein [Jeotgalibacillus sp. ET6]MDG5473378.1 hypothetical protein [Jeotgalibacillus sp. ET6]
MQTFRSSFIRRIFGLFLLPLLIIEPFFSKIILYALPLFILLAFISQIESKKVLTRYNAYILITSLYLIGIWCDETLVRSILLTGLIFSLYILSLDTT